MVGGNLNLSGLICLLIISTLHEESDTTGLITNITNKTEKRENREKRSAEIKLNLNNDLESKKAMAFNKFSDFRFPERELPIPRNVAIDLHRTNVELHCSVSPGISKVLWTIEKASGLLTGTIFDNGRIRPHWDSYYSMNRSIQGQNSLIIRNATMGMAGTYRCATAYPGSELESHSAEVVVVSIEHNLGTIVAPIMYFNWMIKYCGNMSPHVLCSNGEIITGKRSESRFRENLVITSIFTGCFSADHPPLRCSILFKDKKEKVITYKSFEVQLVDSFADVKRKKLRTSNNMLIRGPEDKVIRVNTSINIEFYCDVHPPPDLFSWAFIDSQQQCYGFLRGAVKTTNFPYPLIKFKLRQRFNDISQLDLVLVDDNAAGQYRCVVTYLADQPVRRTFNSELVVVMKTSNYINLVVRGGRMGDRIVTISFRMAFKGNLLPLLICGSQEIRPLVIEQFKDTHDVYFNDTLTIPYIPAACRVAFLNQANKKTVLFEEIYVRKARNVKLIRPGQPEIPKVMVPNQFDFNIMQKRQLPHNVIVKENTKNVVFHCSTNFDAITVTWEFDGVIASPFSGLIYQNGKPLPKNIQENYMVNNSERGQHSLTVLEVKARSAGTYSCSVRFKNSTDKYYRAELVMVNVEEPMSIELLPPGQKWQASFRCVLTYYGRMQPFLKCADLSHNLGDKIDSKPGVSSTVVFEKHMNLSLFPYSCEIHFRDSKGETTLFEVGQTVLGSRHIMASSSVSHDQNLSLILAISSLTFMYHHYGDFIHKYNNNCNL